MLCMMSEPTDRRPEIEVPDTPDELRAFCTRWRIKQRDVAREYGCSPAFICRVLNGYGCSHQVWTRVKDAVRACYLKRWEDS